MALPVLKILTANQLRTGDVLYWRAGDWVDSLAGAEVFADDAAAEAALASAQAFVAANQVVTPYLFDVRQTKTGFVPVKEREVIRSLGPSVRPDTGKQTSHV
ncbi:MAG: DUF2849 domain-containing protein [Pseudomonadota bacterium]